VKIAMQLTLDGIIRALRLKVHTVGEDYEEAVRRAEQVERKDADAARAGIAAFCAGGWR
jgi:hypothetical protein